MTAGIDDECLRGKQGLDPVEPQRSFTAARNQPGGRCREDKRSAFDFGHQRWYLGPPCRAFSLRQRHARRLRAQAPQGDARDH